MSGEKFQQLVDIMARLRGPDGCPWDREQTFDTIKSYLLEEACEVIDAIDRRDWKELAAEPGDLFMMVNIARFLKLDPELALRKTNRKFRERFAQVERGIGERGKTLPEAGIEEMEELWQQAKKR